jgi:hypothetical protein
MRIAKKCGDGKGLAGETLVAAHLIWISAADDRRRKISEC